MIEVNEKLKELCQRDGVPKRIRIIFPDNDYRTLTNADVLAESMRFTENLCSATTFKFGLCEANIFEIKTLYVRDTLKDKKIRPYIDYFDKDNNKWYTVPLGEFIIDSHKREGATPVKTLTAYGKEAELKPTADLYRLYNDVNWLSGTTVPMYAEYVVVPSCFRKEQCNWFNYDDSIYLKEYIDTKTTSASWQRANVTNFQGHAYSQEYKRNIDYSWTIWVNAGREVIKPDDKSNRLSMYYSQGKIDNEAIKKILTRLNNNIESIKREFWEGKADYEEIIMTDADIINLFTHLHWKEKDSDTRYMRDINGYSVVEGLEIGAGYYSNVFAFPTCKSIGWRCMAYYSEGGRQYIVSDDTGEWIIDFAKEYVECVKDIKLERADETNMIQNPDYILGGRRVRPTWLDSKEEYRNYIEDFFELYASFGRTNRYGQFERLEIDAKFAEFTSEKTKIGSFQVSNGKNNYIIDTNARAGAYFEDYVVKKIGTVLFDWSTTIGGQKVTQTYSIKFSDDPNTYYIQDNYHLNYIGFSYSRVEGIIKNLFIPRLKNITWRPMNILIPAHPFVECGDIIRTKLGDEKMDTFVHTRTIQGLQMLTDNIVSDMSEFETYEDIEIAKSIIIDE